MLSTLKKCPFSIVAGHETTIEMNQGSLSYHVAMMSMVRELNRDTNTEEMFTHFKELLNGKCQRQNASDILEFWFSLQASIKSLSKSKVVELLFSFLRTILSQGMENEGALNTFEVPHIFYQICESFIEPSGTDNGAGKCMEENANVKKTVLLKPGLETSGMLKVLSGMAETNAMNEELAPYLLQDESFSSDGPMAEGGNVANNNNSPCCEQLSPTVNPGKLEDCEGVQEVSPSTETLSCEAGAEMVGIDEACASELSRIVNTLTTKVSPSQPSRGKTVESGGIDGASKLNNVVDTSMSKGFVAIAGHTMGETTQACGATHGRKRKNEKAGKNKNSKKVVEVSLPPVLESTSGTLQVHGASKEHNTSKKQRNPAEGSLSVDKKPCLESISIPKHASAKTTTKRPRGESKVSLPPVLDTSGTLQIFGATGEQSSMNTMKRNPGKGKNASLESRKTSHNESAKKTRWPHEESKAPFKEDIPLKEGKKMECPMAAIHKSRDEHKEFTKESMSREVGKKEMPFMETRASSETKGSLASDSMEANLAIEEDDCKPTKFKKPEKESSPKMLSMAMKAPESSDPPPEISEPVQDHEFANLTTDEMDRERLRFSVPIQAPESSDPPPEISEPVQDHEFANLTTDGMDRERLRLSVAMGGPDSSAPEASKPIQDQEHTKPTAEEMDGLQQLSIPMQAPEGAHSPPVLETSKPVQDYGHAKVTRDELQAELYKARKKLDDVQCGYQILMEEQAEKENKLKDQNEKLFLQIQLFVSRLQQYESYDDIIFSKGNPTL